MSMRSFRGALRKSLRQLGMTAQAEHRGDVFKPLLRAFARSPGPTACRRAHDQRPWQRSSRLRRQKTTGDTALLSIWLGLVVAVAAIGAPGELSGVQIEMPSAGAAVRAQEPALEMGDLPVDELELDGRALAAEADFRLVIEPALTRGA
jgi:hypothetical protein